MFKFIYTDHIDIKIIKNQIYLRSRLLVAIIFDLLDFPNYVQLQAVWITLLKSVYSYYIVVYSFSKLLSLAVTSLSKLHEHITYCRRTDFRVFITQHTNILVVWFWTKYYIKGKEATTLKHSMTTKISCAPVVLQVFRFSSKATVSISMIFRKYQTQLNV